MTAVAETNGHVPTNPYAERDTRLADTLASEVDSLRSLLDAEIEGRAELEQLLDASKERERRLARAIAILEHGTQQPQTTQQPKPKAKAAAKNWNVSDETVERVRQAFMQYFATDAEGEPFTMTTLAAWMGQQGNGIGGETIRHAMEKLRADEIVRVCGKTRGGGKLFAPMPDAGPHAD